MIGHHMVCYSCEQELVGSESLDHPYCTECSALIDAAEKAISVARRIGVHRSGPSSWRDVSVQEHLSHAIRHLHPGRKFYTDNAEEEDHLAHAICRLAMAKALQGKTIYKCEETVWLPGPPATEFSGPHKCDREAYGKYLVYNRFTKLLCKEHAEILMINAILLDILQS